MATTRNEWMVQNDVKPANTHQWHRITSRTWPSTGHDAAVAMLNTGVGLAEAQDEAWRTEVKRFIPGGHVDLGEVETFQRRGEIVGAAFRPDDEDRADAISGLRGFASTYGLTFEVHEGVVWDGDMKVVVLTLLDGKR